MSVRGVSVRVIGAAATVVILLALSYYAVFGAASAWPTYQHDAGRSGLDPDAAAITSVTASWNSQLDEVMFAQPLVAGSVVYAATENNTIYALDTTSGALIWQRHLATPARLNQLPCGNIDPYGITGTPVIDSTNGVLYTALLQATPSIHHELYALNLNNGGAVLYHFPIDAPGSDPLAHGQRGALTLANGKVYVPYSGRWGDCGTYKGRVVAVNVGDTTGASLISYGLPNTARGGIWAAGSTDSSGNLYVSTGNSNARGSTPAQADRGESVVKLSPALQELDYFTAPEWDSLNANDTDIGSIGPILLQNGWILQSGKNAMGYLINSANMGHVGGQMFEGRVCDPGDEAMAFGAYLPPTTVFIPCTSALKAVHINTSGSGSFTVTTVRAGYGGDPGSSPPIIAGGLLWNLDNGNRLLLGFNPNTGQQLFSKSLSGTPAHFVAPSSGAGHLFVPSGSLLEAFTVATGGATATPTPTVAAGNTATPTRTSVAITATPTPTSSGTTTLGLTTVGGNPDTGDRDAMNGSRVVVGTQQLGVVSITVYVGGVDAAPNNKYSVAIYTDSGGAPGSLVASSGSGTLQPNSWNTVPIGATLQPNSAYWLIYNTNASTPTLNNLYYDNDPAIVGAYNDVQTFGAWPSAFGQATQGGFRHSIYATANGASQGVATATSLPTVTATPTRTSTPTRVPTVAPVGLTTIGASSDTGDRNSMNGSRVTTTQAMTVTSISAYVGSIDAAPNNQFSFAIYSDAGGAPGSLVAQSGNGTLQANSWNTISLSVRLNASTAYWLFYNTNGTNRLSNNLKYNNDPNRIGAYAARTFGSWPNTYGASNLVTARYSIYASGTP